MNFKLIFLIFLYCVHSLSAKKEPSDSEDDDITDDTVSTDKDDGPIDHSAFLQIDNTEDMQIQNSKESKRKLRKLIKEIDENEDGKVSQKELQKWIEAVIHKYVLSEGEKHMPKIDTDEDKHATWEEYAFAAGYTKGIDPEPRVTSEVSKKRDKEKFDLSDIDNDGKLSYYELGIMIHPNEAPQMGNVLVDDLLQVMDKDKDGKLSAEEFSGGEKGNAEIDESFKQFDKDNSGKLERNEMKDWLMPEEKNPFQLEAEMLREKIDKDKDGHLTEKEIFKSYARFATSRATLYGRLIKPDEDDDVKTKQDEKKEQMKKEEKMEDNKTEKKKADDEL